MAIWACGKSRLGIVTHEQIPTQQKKFYKIQLVALGGADSLHLKAAEKELKKNFPGTLISYSSATIPIKEDMYLVPGKLNSARLLTEIRHIKPDTINSMIGIIGENIAVKERTLSNGRKFKNWSILGYGSLQFGVCVVSYKRIKKIEAFGITVLHEFGHTLGLSHCPDKECIMVDGDGSGKKILKNKGFCAKCQAFIDKKLNPS